MSPPLDDSTPPSSSSSSSTVSSPSSAADAAQSLSSSSSLLPASSAAAEPLSRRRQFRSITPPASLLNHLRDIGVGKPPRRSQQDKSRPRYAEASKNRIKYKNKNKDQQQNVAIDRGLGRKIKNYDPAGKILYASPDKSTRKEETKLVAPPPKPFDPDAAVRLRHTTSHTDAFFPRPNPSFPEVALIGRSNVGKSTLVNALLYGNRASRTTDSGDAYLEEAGRHRTRGRVPDKVKMPKGVKALASSKPGETKELAFFRIKSRETATGLDFVDMPGYGFSFKGSSVEDGAYADLAVRYLTEPRGRALKRLLLLVDARHGLKAADFEFLKGIEDRVKEAAAKEKSGKGEGKGKGKGKGNEALRIPPIQVVLTKSDMVEQADLARRIVQTRDQMSDALSREYGNLQIMCVSAQPGKGFNNVGWTKTGQFVARGGVLELQRELAAIQGKAKDDNGAAAAEAAAEAAEAAK